MAISLVIFWTLYGHDWPYTRRDMPSLAGHIGTLVDHDVRAGPTNLAAETARGRPRARMFFIITKFKNPQLAYKGPEIRFSETTGNPIPGVLPRPDSE